MTAQLFGTKTVVWIALTPNSVVMGMVMLKTIVIASASKYCVERNQSLLSCMPASGEPVNAEALVEQGAQRKVRARPAHLRVGQVELVGLGFVGDITVFLSNNDRTEKRHCLE